MDSIFATPSKGKNTRGMRAVIAIGTASVAHHTPIKTKIAAALCASGAKPSLSGKTSTMKLAIIPTKKPTLFLLFDIVPLDKV